MSKRILILGGPRCGKTTHAKKLAAELGLPVKHFDDMIGTGDWSEISSRIALELDETGPWIKEGVAGVRALRKWLAANPDRVPPFEIVVLNQPHVEHSKGQAAMHKGHATILAEVQRTLDERRSAESSAIEALETTAQDGAQSE